MCLKKMLLQFLLALVLVPAYSQVSWVNVDSLFGSLPSSIHVYRTTDPLDGKPNIAYYLIADINDKDLSFESDTSHMRRLTPQQFYEKNNKPFIVVNTSFFSFQTNQNLSVVIKDGIVVGFNIHSLPGRGKDTLTYRHPVGSALGISRKRKADVAWLYTDSTNRYAYAFQKPVPVVRDSAFSFILGKKDLRRNQDNKAKKWKMETAVGGGPVLIQHGEIRITNNEELKFAGRAINDKHPRTAMGITSPHAKQGQKLVILVIQGRTPGIAEGATLTQEAQILKELGCHEALNLDGGGSSCMLVNGKETIKPSDAAGQRAVPAVLLIKSKGKSQK